MARNLYTFVADIDDNLVAPENFYKGLYNLYNRLLETSGIPPQNQLPSYLRNGQEALDSHPQLLGAHCIRGICGLGSDQFRETAFDYETSMSARKETESNASYSLLVAALKGLAFVTDSEACDSEMDASPLAAQKMAQDMLIGAFFSTRGVKDLGLGGLSSPQSVVNQQDLDEEEEDEGDISKFSIGAMVEWCFGTGWRTAEETDSYSGWKRALENWLLLLDNDNFEKLLPHLSEEQSYSARILIEWWNGEIDFEPATQQSRDIVYRSAAMGVAPRDSEVVTQQYQAKMMELFEYEFHAQYYPLWVTGSMSSHRGLRAGRAAAQRLSMMVYKDLLCRHGVGCGIPSSHDANDLRLRDVAGEHSKRLAASISPCAWLPNADTDNGMPYYLWDIQRRRTVATQELQGKVEYTAISHTWGRWKKHDSPAMHINGVDGWLIPQNTRFNVTELPNILSSACLETPYAWFDLLCIPQTPDSEQLQQIGRDEIARQAKIFRGAKHAAAWFNDVEGCTGIHLVLRQLALSWLHSQQELPGWLLNLMNSDQQTELELFIMQGDERGVPNGWFSSLWTLQELCLRPDMILLDRQWRPFAIDATPVRLDDLAALMSACEGNRDDAAKHLPLFNTPEALYDLFHHSGLIAIRDAGRVDIISMGNQRTCTDNRAEAIMSALGVTDWYSKGRGSTANDQNTLSDATTQHQHVPNDQYPVPFIREAALKIGPEFYTATFSNHEITLFLVNALSPPMTESAPRSIGTLLPFGNTTAFARRILPKGGVWGSPHPSVRTWTIQDDLSVEICQAAVISYTGQERQEARLGKITGILWAPKLENYIPLSVEMQEGVDLDRWVDSFYPQSRNFAVCLSYASTAIEGVLLKETVTGDLVKVGLFWVTGFVSTGGGMPESYQVNWRVL
ncbi:hypothetical protein ASPSYDRAFT_1049073 [Aspergillus sydowii CBS 593.65]|uniref:Heterokaryon incompatibility domain-containing protein n=1 Tax=Aspergillus sydowii CBS 593.65 TaxID=1036612 RepID=A0A1L9TGG6_9EURO|nr:uncharacterized protein ASPSYDRAFT_1049073 [Aspergillus sydowii CBS 593.65]OJJ58383.1 hypothetical protein ASPSYDRAFT_1049073 [Aspergillus sydowii CBS 593.65]